MKSKFTAWAYLSVLFLVPVIGVLALITISVIRKLPDEWTPVIAFSICFLFTLAWLVFGEMRLRMIAVEITNDCLVVATFLGLGKKRKLYFYELDGYETTLLPSKYNTYEYLFVLRDGKRVARISAFYHRNYKELKTLITKKLKHLGSYDFQMGKELKDLFG